MLGGQRLAFVGKKCIAGIIVGQLPAFLPRPQVQRAANTLANLSDAGYTVDELKLAGLSSWTGSSNANYLALGDAGYTAADIADYSRIWEIFEADNNSIDPNMWASSSLQLQDALSKRRGL